METGPGKIEELSKKKEDENWEFRSFLKGCDTAPEEIDSIVHRLYQQVCSENVPELEAIKEDFIGFMKNK